MQALTMDYQLTIPAILRRVRAHFAGKQVVSRRGTGALRRTTFGAVLDRAFLNIAARGTARWFLDKAARALSTAPAPAHDSLAAAPAGASRSDATGE